jgi:hypothetical protein
MPASNSRYFLLLHFCSSQKYENTHHHISKIIVRKMIIFSTFDILLLFSQSHSFHNKLRRTLNSNKDQMIMKEIHIKIL